MIKKLKEGFKKKLIVKMQFKSIKLCGWLYQHIPESTVQEP